MLREVVVPVLLLAVVSCSGRPPYVLLTIEDPTDVAGSAMQIAIGKTKDSLQITPLGKNAFPVTITVVSEAEERADLHVEAKTDNGTVLARGFTSATFASDGAPTATVQLSRACSTNNDCPVDPTCTGQNSCDENGYCACVSGSPPSIAVETPTDHSSTGTIAITLLLSDKQSDPAQVSATYSVRDALSGQTRTGTASAQPPLLDLATSEAGVEHPFHWAYEADLGDRGGYEATLTFTATDWSGASLPVATSPFLVGNDPPELVPFADASYVKVQGQTGNLVITFNLADSTGDTVSLLVEATSNRGPQPVTQIVAGNTTDLETRDNGDPTRLSFVWDTEAEIGATNLSAVQITLTPIDKLGLVGTPRVSALGEISNNTRPIAVVSEPALGLDDSREIALDVTLFDEQYDPVDIEVQWSRTSTFPDLPLQRLSPRVLPVRGRTERSPTGASTTAIFAPTLLATRPARYLGNLSGLLSFQGSSTTVTGQGTRFVTLRPGDEILGADGLWYAVAQITDDTSLLLDLPYDGGSAQAPAEHRRHPFVQQEVQILAPFGKSTIASSLSAPVGVLVEPGETTALIADGSSIARIELATGTVLQRSGSLGAPSHLALQPSGTTALVTDGDGRLLRLDLQTLQEQLVIGLTDPRSVVSLGEEVALVVQGNGTLYHINTVTLTITTLLTGLADPWGMAYDSRRRLVYIAERGTTSASQRITRYDLDRSERSEVTNAANNGPPNPAVLVLGSDGRSLYVATHEGGASRLFALVGLQTLHLEQSVLSQGPTMRDMVQLGETLLLSEGDSLQRFDLGNRVTASTTVRRVSFATGTIEVDPFSSAIGENIPFRLADVSSGLRGLTSSPDGTTHKLALEMPESLGTPDGFYFQVTPRDEASGIGAGAATSAVRSLTGRFNKVARLLISDPSAGVDAGDIDGDGSVDVVSANADGLSISFQNAFDRFFIFASMISMSSIPNDVRVVDLDSDGHNDIVTAQPFSDELYIFLQGSSPPLVLSLPANTMPSDIEVGDLDGDRDIDIVSANLNDLTVYQQSLPGVFTTSMISDSRLSPTDVAVGDLNQDGTLEIVASNPTSLAIISHAKGGFSVSSLITNAGFGHVAGVNTSDMDGDGALDLIAADSTAKALFIFRQTTRGTFDEPPVVIRTREEPDAIDAGDFDGDGDLDLVVSLPEEIGVYYQTASNTFATETLLSAPYQPNAPRVVDLDGDGDLDIITSDRSSNSAMLFYQSRAKLFTSDDLASAETDGPEGVAIGDLDSDGDLDIVSANPHTACLTVFYQTGGVFSPTPTILRSPTSDFPDNVIIADLDADGDLDLAATDQGKIDLFLQERPGVFASTTLSDAFATNIAVGDLDADGDQDLALVNASGDRIHWYLQEAGGFTLSPSSVSAPSAPLHIAVGDLDGDGDQDLVSSNSSSDNLTLFFQTAPGTFSSGPILSSASIGIPMEVAIGDLDGDGDNDIVSANSGSDNLTIFWQSGSGSYLSTLTVLSNSQMDQPMSVALGDLDQDGRLDVFSGNEGSDNLAVFLQLAPGRFTPAGTFSTNSMAGPVSIRVKDLNGDGDLDVVSANRGSSDLSLFIKR